MKKHLPFFITNIIVTTLFIAKSHSQIIEIDEQKYIAKKFDSLSLFDSRLILYKNEKVIICHQSEINQDGGRYFNAIYSQFDYSNPEISRHLGLINDVGIPVVIDYFFMLKGSKKIYAKIKYKRENGELSRWVIHVRLAFAYSEIQIPNCGLISQYDFFKEFLHQKKEVGEKDITDYLTLFENVEINNKNEFRVNRINDVILSKCDSLKQLTIERNKYFQPSYCEFNKYNFEKDGFEINIKTQFEYRLEPEQNRETSLMGGDRTSRKAILSFNNIKREKSKKEIENLESAFKMGLVSIEYFNSQIAGQDSLLLVPIPPNEAERAIIKIDSISHERVFYLIYEFEIIGSSYSTLFQGVGEKLEIKAELQSVSLYYDPNYLMPFRKISFKNNL